MTPEEVRKKPDGSFYLYRPKSSKEKTRENKTTSEEVKRLRQKLGLTQAELAYKLGVTVSCVANWETGRRKISTPAARLLRLLAD